MKTTVCVVAMGTLALSACSTAKKPENTGSGLANPVYSSESINGQNPVEEYIARKKRQREAGITLKDIAGLSHSKTTEMTCVDFGSKCFVHYKAGELTMEQLQTAAKRVCEDEHSIVSSTKNRPGSETIKIDGNTFEFNCILKSVAQRG